MKTAADARQLATKNWDDALNKEIESMLVKVESIVDAAIAKGLMQANVWHWTDITNYNRASIRFNNALQDLGYEVEEVDNYKNIENDYDSGCSISVSIKWGK